MADRSRRGWYIFGGVLAAARFLLPQQVRQDLGWVDAVSGSKKSQTVWRAEDGGGAGL